MRIKNDFDKLVLLSSESRELRRIRRRRSVPKATVRHFDNLYEADLISYDYDNSVRDERNRPVRLDTIHVTELYLRYAHWRRCRWLSSVVLPIAISVITTTILYTLEHLLLPTLLRLIANLFA